jgi:hypothetical protein
VYTVNPGQVKHFSFCILFVFFAVVLSLVIITLFTKNEAHQELVLMPLSIELCPHRFQREQLHFVPFTLSISIALALHSSHERLFENLDRAVAEVATARALDCHQDSMPSVGFSRQ